MVTPTAPYEYLRAFGDFHQVDPSLGGRFGNGNSTLFDNFSITLVPATTATVSGEVYEDINSNGTLNTSELGLDGVYVGLYQAGQTSPIQTVATQNTPNLGGYSFSNLADGTYYLALVDEGLYDSVTQPGSANGLISGYSMCAR